MDTAQRGMGLDWDAAKELIKRSVAEAKAVGGRIVCGAQTDQLAPGSARSLRDIEAAYEEQCGFVEEQSGQVVIMASRELVHVAKGPDDYARVYGHVLSQLRQPALIHWLGEVFDPALAGYWGHTDLDGAMAACLEVITANRDKVEGLKLSLLDQRLEIDMRRRLPDGVHMFTGDDFDYPTTIAGDGDRYSDALLGAFDLIAPAASAALVALDSGNAGRFDEILQPTVPVARHAFGAPTFYYKTGIVFLAYLKSAYRPVQDFADQLQRHVAIAARQGRNAIALAADLLLHAGKLGSIEQRIDHPRLQRAIGGIGVNHQARGFQRRRHLGHRGNIGMRRALGHGKTDLHPA